MLCFMDGLVRGSGLGAGAGIGETLKVLPVTPALWRMRLSRICLSLW